MDWSQGNNSTWAVVGQDMKRLASRKLWVTILATVLVSLAEAIGIELEQESIIAIAGMVIAYVTGQAIVDRGKVVAEIQARIPGLIGNLTNLLEEVKKDELTILSEPQETAQKIVDGGYA